MRLKNNSLSFNFPQVGGSFEGMVGVSNRIFFPTLTSNAARLINEHGEDSQRIELFIFESKKLPKSSQRAETRCSGGWRGFYNVCISGFQHCYRPMSAVSLHFFPFPNWSVHCVTIVSLFKHCIWDVGKQIFL